MPETVLECVRCPRCTARLDIRAQTIVCGRCGERYPRLGAIPILLPDAQAYLALCRRQLTDLEQQLASTVRVLEEQLHAPDVLPLTKVRGRAVIEAARGQAADVCAILQPLVDGAGADSAPAAPTGAVPSVLTNIHYLFRDWGWTAEPQGENERAIASVEAALGRQPPGRTCVLGAGACRLAYDLHRRTGASETAVVDIDPFLFAVAHTVIRGGTVAVREGYAEINELEHAVTHWELKAADGALDEERFHFALADGMEPPFQPAAFDTVVTPWFIDVIPADLRDVISTVHRLLKPEGRWVALGPLRYTPQVPISRRFAREEVFDLAGRAGFRIGFWKSESVPSLVSKQNGRGKIEWVMTFAATKCDVPAAGTGGDGPTPWLLFRHVPVPTFAGQSLIWTEDPLATLVLSAIDGQRTLDDLALLVARRIKQAGPSRSQIREAVRRCLADVHPACRA